MEISCRVNVTFVSALPFPPPTTSSFGVFLGRMEKTRIKEGPWQQGWQRAISKGSECLDSLRAGDRNTCRVALGEKELISCLCLLNLIKKCTYHCSGVREWLGFGKEAEEGPLLWSVCFSLSFHAVISVEQIFKRNRSGVSGGKRISVIQMIGKNIWASTQNSDACFRLVHVCLRFGKDSRVNEWAVCSAGIPCHNRRTAVWKAQPQSSRSANYFAFLISHY